MIGMPLLLAAADPQLPLSTLAFAVTSAVKVVVVFTVYLVSVALLTLAERKVSAWIQDRRGPNRAGPMGLLQPAADGLKNFMKEETYPEAADRTLFVLAPAMALVPACLTWAVIPFGAPLPTPWGRVDLVIADLPVGFLFTLAIASLGVYGMVLAGWASNSKYSLLGGLRSSAQMVSYEISMGLSAVAVLLLAGNVTLSSIIEQQATQGWNVLLLSVACLVFIISSFAETNRLPFDMPEAESELVAGYHSEYSAMKFSMFFIAEYANMITASALIVSLFFGGWDIPFTAWDNAAPWSVAKSLLTFGAFVTKVGFFLFLFMWVRWTLPRFRYDQLMSLGWKVLLPVSLGYIVLIASLTLALEAAGVARTGWVFGGTLLGINLVLVALLAMVLDRGRLVSPASSRLDARRVAALQARAAALRSAAGAD
jgi:NADH-quinone oxidoreductase subunit H